MSLWWVSNSSLWSEWCCKFGFRNWGTFAAVVIIPHFSPLYCPPLFFLHQNMESVEVALLHVNCHRVRYLSICTQPIYLLFMWIGDNHIILGLSNHAFVIFNISCSFSLMCFFSAILFQVLFGCFSMQI